MNNSLQLPSSSFSRSIPFSEARNDANASLCDWVAFQSETRRAASLNSSLPTTSRSSATSLPAFTFSSHAVSKPATSARRLSSSDFSFSTICLRCSLSFFFSINPSLTSSGIWPSAITLYSVFTTSIARLYLEYNSLIALP